MRKLEVRDVSSYPRSHSCGRMRNTTQVSWLQSGLVCIKFTYRQVNSMNLCRSPQRIIRMLKTYSSVTVICVSSWLRPQRYLLNHLSP